MESVANTDVEFCGENMDENDQDIQANDENIQEISENLSSSFLTASDLFSRRTNRSKEEDIEFKGPKLYYPNESTVIDERIEDILLGTKRNLEIQRIAKNRDCIKAEWNEELKVAIVPYLKGKTMQHMGIAIKEKCALSPEETLFLLEKGSIEVMHNKISLSVEEAYTVILKGKLSVEKYEVYSFLSQQGFIVVNHQLKTGPIFEKIRNLFKTKAKKRKATDDAVELPKQKRLTFTGVLASSSSEANFATTQSSISMSDSELNNSESSNIVQPVSQNTLNILHNENLSQDTNAKINSEESEDTTISPDSTFHNEFNDFTEKETAAASIEMQDGNNVGQANDICPKDKTSSDKNADDQKNENVNNKNPIENHNNNKEIDDKNLHDNEIDVEHGHGDNEIDVEHGHGDKIDVEHDHGDNEIDVEHDHGDNEIDVEHGHGDNEIVVEHGHGDNEIVVEQHHDDNEIDVEHSHDDNEIDVENTNDGVTSEIFIEDEGKGDKSDDINIDNSVDNYDNEEYLSSDDSIPVVCEESNEKSMDVYGYYADDCEQVPISKRDDLKNRPSNEHDDEVTLVEVKKKEKKPLAVIDLLSDEEDSGAGKNKKRNSKQLGEGANVDEECEESDDEIQVIDVFPVSTNNAQGTSRTKYSSSVKLESNKLKIPVDTSNVKSSYTPQMKFPDSFRKDIICVPRPPNHLLPLHVQPAKEAYVLNTIKSSQPKQGRVWNSYRDMQDYQRERRLERHMNSFNARSGPFRDHNDSFSNRVSPFNSLENSRDPGFNRNNQSYPLQQNRNLYQPLSMNQNERPNALLPSPNVYNPQNHIPFNMNIHNLQSLSSSNPAAFVDEIQKTVYSVATSMISSMLGQHLNRNTPPPAHSPVFGEPSMMSFTPHSNNSFTPSPGFPGPLGYNSPGRSDLNPVRFPPQPTFSGERYPFSMNNAYTSENNWRQPNHFRQRNFAQRGPLFPCKYRTVPRKRDWHDVKAAVQGTSDSNSGSDIEEVPINLNQFLWSNDIQPLVKPGSKLPVADVLKALRITQMANLYDTKCCNDRYLPTTPSLEISFDVYLPNSKYKRSEPSAPKCRIIVVRSSDPIPRYSELVYLQRKWNDGVSLQIAVVDHSDISFYSFNSLSVPDIVPSES